MTTLQPIKGKLTFEAEGTEGGRFHSRVLHVPSATSGLTIGRGYDMREKTASKIKKDMTQIGLGADSATTLSKAAGLYGSSAEEFKRKNSLDKFEITPKQQVDLFNISYQEAEADVKRICAKEDVTEAYGACNWELLFYGIKEVLVDMRFRGDYTIGTRRLIQKSAAENNLTEFYKTISDTEIWSKLNVPSDRIKRRIDFLKSAIVKSGAVMLASTAVGAVVSSSAGVGPGVGAKMGAKAGFRLSR